MTRVGDYYRKNEVDEQDANKLLDNLVSNLRLKNDAALAKKLDVPPPLLSKLRHGVCNISPAFLLRCHDATGFSISDIRFMAKA